MAVHTYVVNALTVIQQTAQDVLWDCTGTADGIPFNVQFWQSSVAAMTTAQLKTYVKGLIDAQLFPTLATPSGVLSNFAGGTFTQ
jgi:hypothetical protein